MKKFVKFIGYLIVALMLSVPFNWLGNWIGDFLVYRSTHSFSGSPFMTIGLNLLTVILIILTIVSLIAALFIGPYMIVVPFHFGDKEKETGSECMELGLGWFYCLNMYVIIQMLAIKYTENQLLEFFSVIANVVFGIVSVVYIILFGAMIFEGFKALMEWMHNRSKQPKRHFKPKRNIKF